MTGGQTDNKMGKRGTFTQNAQNVISDTIINIHDQGLRTRPLARFSR